MSPVPFQGVIPKAFLEAGFQTFDSARRHGPKKRRGLMVVIDGESDTGKTELMMTFPGPGVVLACDRGFDALVDNPKPPPTRRSDFFVKVIRVPAATQFGSADKYGPYWLEYLKAYIEALKLEEARTIGVDGDNHTWDLQRLAEFGKLAGVAPQTRYADPYAARKALYWRAWDTGKIIVCTNMMRDEYATVLDVDGNAVLDDEGRPKKEKTGQKVHMGFPNRSYLWQVGLRTLYKEPRRNTITKKMMPGQWGCRITKAKANPELVGEELWGDSCTFEGIMSLIYPHVPLEEWGL